MSVVSVDGDNDILKLAPRSHSVEGKLYTKVCVELLVTFMYVVSWHLQ